VLAKAEGRQKSGTPEVMGWRVPGSSQGRRPMSRHRRARLPSCSMIAANSSRHSGWPFVMPRSRQMSARTTPMGLLRICLAICSGVARRMGLASALSRFGVAKAAARGVGGARTTTGLGSGAWRASRRVSLASSARARCRPRMMLAKIWLKS
jgi:hypothetical protein